MRPDRRWVAILLFALVALVARDASLPHQHSGAGPGLFNRDHDLGTLATVSGGLVPDSPQPARLIVSPAPVVITARAVPPATARRLADPRGPPHHAPSRSA